MLMDVPILLSGMLEEMVNPSSIFDQNFGLGMVADDFFHPTSMMRMPLSRGYYRPWRHIRGRDSGVSTIASTNSEFKVRTTPPEVRPPCVVTYPNREFALPGELGRAAVQARATDRQSRRQLCHRRGQTRRTPGRTRIHFPPVPEALRPAGERRSGFCRVEPVIRWRAVDLRAKEVTPADAERARRAHRSDPSTGHPAEGGQTQDCRSRGRDHGVII